MKLSGINLDPNDFKRNISAGDGAATEFELTHTPVAAAALDVYVNGIKRNNWTLDAKTVTFDAAPENGQDIEFSYIKKD